MIASPSDYAARANIMWASTQTLNSWICHDLNSVVSLGDSIRCKEGKISADGTLSVPICGKPKIFTLQRGFIAIPPSPTSISPTVWICCALVPCSSPRFTQIRCERVQSEAACQSDSSQRENRSDRSSEATQSIHD